MSSHTDTSTRYGAYIHSVELPGGDRIVRDPDLSITLDTAGVPRSDVADASIVVSLDREHMDGSVVITDATLGAAADLRAAAEVLRRVADQLQRVEGNRP